MSDLVPSGTEKHMGSKLVERTKCKGTAQCRADEGAAKDLEPGQHEVAAVAHSAPSPNVTKMVAGHYAACSLTAVHEISD